MDFEVSLQKFRFGPVSMGVHRGYSCNDLMLLAALKLQKENAKTKVTKLQRPNAACGIETKERRPLIRP